MVIREMQEEDVPAVVRLEMESFSDAWSEKSVLESLKQTFSYCLVVLEEKQIVGYLIFYKSLDEGEILRIAVKKSERKSGVGTHLIEKMKQYCQENHVKKVMLDVRISNRVANKFYKKQGFVVDGERKHFYSNPDETAVLMSRRG